jgi:hypothetical protein
MQSISSQTPEGILGNGGMLDGDRERREEDRGRQREEWRVERGVSRGAERKSALAYRVERISLEDCQTNVFVEVLRVRW